MLDALVLLHILSIVQAKAVTYGYEQGYNDGVDEYHGRWEEYPSQHVYSSETPYQSIQDYRSEYGSHSQEPVFAPPMLQKPTNGFWYEPELGPAWYPEYYSHDRYGGDPPNTNIERSPHDYITTKVTPHHKTYENAYSMESWTKNQASHYSYKPTVIPLANKENESYKNLLLKLSTKQRGSNKDHADNKKQSISEPVTKRWIPIIEDVYYDVPHVMESLTKNVIQNKDNYERPVGKVSSQKGGSNEADFDKPGVGELTKTVEPDMEYENPVVVETLIKNVNPSKPKDTYDEIPTVVKTLTNKEDPERPAVVLLSANVGTPVEDAYYGNPGVAELTKETKPEDVDYDDPLVIEMLTKDVSPSKWKDSDYEIPNVVESLTKNLMPDLSNTLSKRPIVEMVTNNHLSVPIWTPNKVGHKKQHKNKKNNKKQTLTESGTHEVKSEVHERSLDTKYILDNILDTSDSDSYFETGGNSINQIEDLNFEGVELGSTMELNENYDILTTPLGPNFRSILSFQMHERLKFRKCTTIKNETGNCMPLQMCSVPNLSLNVEEVLKNSCVLDEVFIGICCPEFPGENVRVAWETKINLNDEKEQLVQKECGQSSLLKDKIPSSWMAALISTDRIFCGGVLISELYILTAAHCTTRIPKNQILVRLGHPYFEEHPGEDFEVVEIKRHSAYSARTRQNDIALLRLARKVQLGDLRRPVCLPNVDENHIGQTAVLLRWKESVGKSGESLRVHSNKECRNSMGTIIGKSFICTEPSNADTRCNAESGAPLVSETDGTFKVIGVLTWDRNDCNNRLPSIFTRVFSYLGWINKYTS